MKKNIKFIIPIIIIFVLLVTLIIIVFSRHTDKNECFGDLNAIFEEINLSVPGGFDIVDNDTITMHYTLEFANFEDYIMGVSLANNEEHFIIIKGMQKDEIEYLKYLLNEQKEINPDLYTNSKIESHNEYTYLVVSADYYSTIDGIIRSFIYCD